MSFDTRVKDHLREAGDLLTAPPADLSGVVVRGRRRRMTRILASAVGATVLIIGLVVLMQTQPIGPPVVSQPTSTTTAASLGGVNGWVAFASGGEDFDIYLVRQGQVARRIVGSDSDGLDQMCPAFAPDGARLAYGQAAVTPSAGYSKAALVISDLDVEGNASVSLEIDVSGNSVPPCAIWSPDGRRVAFGVHEGGRGQRPQGSSTQGDVWVVDLDTREPVVLSDMYLWDEPASAWADMEWSPDGTELAIANGQISLYSTLTGGVRPLEGSSATGDYLLAGGPEGGYGIGPMWSPNRDRMVYLRTCGTYPSSISPTDPCNEEHEVVLVTPDGNETVLPYLRLPGADETDLWWPYRVTWSPDGQQLLYLAWGPADDPDKFATALIAVPIDPDSPPVLLVEDPQISIYDEGFQLAVQTWGRQTEAP